MDPGFRRDDGVELDSGLRRNDSDGAVAETTCEKIS